MKKYLLVLVSLCCALLPALAEHPEYPELKKSDANIIGHVLDKKTSEQGIARRSCGMQCRSRFFSLRVCVKAPKCGGSPRPRRCGRCPL